MDRIVQADHDLDFGTYARKLLLEKEGRLIHYIPYQKIIYGLERYIGHDQRQFLLAEIVQKTLLYIDSWLETFLQKKTLEEYF